jgi:hypothetical protein
MFPLGPERSEILMVPVVLSVVEVLLVVKLSAVKLDR